MGMSKLWESKQKMERLNRRVESGAKIRYEDRYRRITIYLENEIYDKLQVLRNRGFTQTTVINAALGKRRLDILRNCPVKFKAIKSL